MLSSSFDFNNLWKIKKIIDKIKIDMSSELSACIFACVYWSADMCIC